MTQHGKVTKGHYYGTESIWVSWMMHSVKWYYKDGPIVIAINIVTFVIIIILIILPPILIPILIPKKYNYKIFLSSIVQLYDLLYIVLLKTLLQTFECQKYKYDINNSNRVDAIISWLV